MSTGDVEWMRAADEVAVFRRERGRWPVVASSGPVERRLGAWLADRRAHERAGRGWSHAHRHAYLDEVAPGWREGDRGDLWRATADAVAAFHWARGRWPAGSTVDPLEGRLGKWLSKQRTAVAGVLGIPAARRAYLDRVAPGWD